MTKEILEYTHQKMNHAQTPSARNDRQGTYQHNSARRGSFSLLGKQLLLGTAITVVVSLGVLGSTLIPAQAQIPSHMARATTTNAQLSFADLVEKVSPAVVSIHTEKSVKTAVLPPAMEELFRRQFRGEPGDLPQRERRAAAQGSGFFIDSAGHIVTNHHVIDKAEVITVKLKDGREKKAEIIGVDPNTDLAVLKVQPDKDQPRVRFAREMGLRVGDWVLAVGNPFGLGGTVTSGIVSALGRDNTHSNYMDYIQIDAPINQGNSGGPTFNLNGQVVGVNTAIFSPGMRGGSVGIGFAIPSDTAQKIVTQLIKKGTITRGWLGVSIQDITDQMAEAMDLDTTSGALVAEVMEATPAAKAGLKDGDVVVALEGRPVDNARSLTRMIGEMRPGQKIKASLYRDGKKRMINVTLGEREESKLANTVHQSQEDEADLQDKFGAKFGRLDKSAREKYRVPEGVEGVLVAGVLPGMPAEEANLVPGMVILSVDGRKVGTPADLANNINQAEEQRKEAVVLRVQIGDRKHFIALPID